LEGKSGAQISLLHLVVGLWLQERILTDDTLSMRGILCFDALRDQLRETASNLMLGCPNSRGVLPHLAQWTEEPSLAIFAWQSSLRILDDCSVTESQLFSLIQYDLQLTRFSYIKDILMDSHNSVPGLAPEDPG
jgi:hypothetical protein